MRLKGYSSLTALGGDMPGGLGNMPNPPEGFDPSNLPEGFDPSTMPEPPAGTEADDAGTDATADAAQVMPEGRAGGMGGARSGASIDEDDPTTYPLLISFDKYVDGQVYQGISELSLRSGIPSLNEATALSALSMTDQSTQRYSYVTYSVNGGSTLSRIVLENPDEYYATRLGDGILYKADSESSLTYQGDDPATYTDQFKQENDKDNENEQPIIDFLFWLDSADEQEFEDNLDNYVDVESLAKYFATQNLLINSDDMSGPGRNYYLWYDNSTSKFTVLAWDMDLSLNGNSELSPDSTNSMGMGRGGKNAAEGNAPGMPAMPGRSADTTQTTGSTPTESDSATSSAESADNTETQATEEDRPASKGTMMSSGADTFKERFLSNEKFKAIYEEQYWELYDQLFTNDALADVVNELRTQVPATDGLSQEEIDSSADSLLEIIERRKEYLAGVRGGETEESPTTTSPVTS